MKIKGNLQSNVDNNIASYVSDTGSANAYAIALRPAITAYTTGLKVRFQATNANSGASTLAVNGLTAKAIKKSVTTDLTVGDILANQIVELIYDGTNFQIQAGAGGTGSGSFDYPQVLFTQIFS